MVSTDLWGFFLRIKEGIEASKYHEGGNLERSIPYCITAGCPAKTRVWNYEFALESDQLSCFVAAGGS